MPLAARDSITGLVLAGGQGSRIGGADEGLLEFHGLPLIEHVLGRLARQVDTVMISANRNQERYRALVPRVIGDAGGGQRYHGPLAGIHAGLVHAPTAWVVVVPCDVPQLSRALVARLAEAVNARGVLAACARSESRLQPVFCLLATALVAPLGAHIERGGRAVHSWLAEVGAAPVDFDDPMAFRDLGTLAALSGGPA
ncbi:MAG TPA: molybdenum cofactor guanylyltransferase MobA [Burkholderiaceae bacterium]|nr:molybdenum cofactor guanylyltransferase MobA [Burkholderiaceae bacterium]